MTAMLNSYVSFVKGETTETIENIKLNDLIRKICLSNKSEKIKITDDVKYVEFFVNYNQLKLIRVNN